MIRLNLKVEEAEALRRWHEDRREFLISYADRYCRVNGKKKRPAYLRKLIDWHAERKNHISSSIVIHRRGLKSSKTG